MTSYSILVIGLTISFFILVFELRIYHASKFKYEVYKLCEACEKIIGEDYFELYNKLPSVYKLVLALKPLKLESWYDKDDIQKFSKILDKL